MFVAYMRTVRKPSKCPVTQKLGNSSILYGKTKNSFELRIWRNEGVPWFEFW